MLRHHSMWLLVAFLGTGFGQSDAKKVTQTSGARSHSDDDAAIKQVAAQYAEYWNRHEFERTAETPNGRFGKRECCEATKYPS